MCLCSSCCDGGHDCIHIEGLGALLSTMGQVSVEHFKEVPWTTLASPHDQLPEALRALMQSNTCVDTCKFIRRLISYVD